MNANAINVLAPSVGQLKLTPSQLELAKEAADSFSEAAAVRGSVHQPAEKHRPIVHSASASLAERKQCLPDQDPFGPQSSSRGPSPQHSRPSSTTDLTSPSSAWSSAISINSGGSQSPETILHYLRRNYLNCIILDVQASNDDSRKTILGAILKRDFFKHRAFRWFSTGQRQNSPSSSVTSKTAQVTHDVVFLTSGVVERVNQLPHPPVLFVYDNTGDREDVACRLVRTLKAADKDVIACYLQGGISSFARRFPYFTGPRPQMCQLQQDASAPDAVEVSGPRLRLYQAAILSGQDVAPSLILRRDWTDISKSKARFPLGSVSASQPSFATGVGISSNGSSTNMAAGSSSSTIASAESLANPTTPSPTAGPTSVLAEHIEATSNAPFLFLSGMKGAAEEYIVRHQITHVLNVTHHQHMTSLNHVEYLRIAIDDNPKVNIHEFFDVATAFIESARKRPDGRILVHCFAGVSRSVSMVLAYLIRFHNCTLLQGYDIVFRNRPVAQPNEGFARKLQKYEMVHRKSTHPSIAYGWLSASNTAFLDFIEFVEGYDELYRRALSRRHANASSSASGSPRTSNANLSATSSSMIALESPSLAGAAPAKSNRRFSVGTNMNVTASVQEAFSPTSTQSRSRSGSLGTTMAPSIPSPFSSPNGTRQTRTRLILSGLYNSATSRSRTRGPTM